MLIFSQAPDASQVAGFRKWQELGRQVRKGEKAIKIFGYSTKKITETDTETGEETTRRAPRFRYGWWRPPRWPWWRCCWSMCPPA